LDKPTVQLLEEKSNLLPHQLHIYGNVYGVTNVVILSAMKQLGN
jgi:hypothetical protein